MIASTQVEVGSVFFFPYNLIIFLVVFFGTCLWYRKKQAQWVFMVDGACYMVAFVKFFSISLPETCLTVAFFPKIQTDISWLIEGLGCFGGFRLDPRK